MGFQKWALFPNYRTRAQRDAAPCGKLIRKAQSRAVATISVVPRTAPWPSFSFFNTLSVCTPRWISDVKAGRSAGTSGWPRLPISSPAPAGTSALLWPVSHVVRPSVNVKSPVSCPNLSGQRCGCSCYGRPRGGLSCGG